LRKLPKFRNSLLLRTDFSDDAAWTAVRKAVRAKSPEGFQANVRCISDPSYDGMTVDQLVELASQGFDHTFAFLVDRLTLTNSEHPVLIVDLYHDPGRTFRVIPSEMWSVENNLSLANMDWESFARDDDGDEVFRGFPES